jgi:hypothetical protein
MGEKFNTELEKAKKLSKYNQLRASRLLDDMATAYLSTEFNGLDESLIAVKTAKKAMRAQGIPQDVIDEYFLLRPLSKTRLRELKNESIYTGDSVTVKPVIENRPALFNTATTTDIIIDGIKDRPELLACLQRGMRADNIQRKFNITNTTLLINFYNQHKDIIDN